MERLFIIHGWGGHPNECWFQWLKKEMEAKGFHVEVPQMPDADAPNIQKWVGHLLSLVGECDAETYFVGHSIGVQAILRYLASQENHAGGVLAVAGFYTLIDGSMGEYTALAEPWLTTPIDDGRVRDVAGSIYAVFSDNDPYVGLENEQMFRERLHAATSVEHGRGHMGANDNLPEAPFILDTLMKIAGRA